MARAAVVDPDIEGGRRLIEALDAAGFPVSSAFWFFDPSPEDWRLVISTPMVDTKGPLKAYEAIDPVLQNLGPVEFRLIDIVAVGAKDRWVTPLRAAIHTGPGITGMRIRRNVLNGLQVEDAYIYRLQ